MKKYQNNSRQSLTMPSFGSSGRTVPARFVAGLFLLAYSVPQPAPGTSRTRLIRSRIAANYERGTCTSADWNVTPFAWLTTFVPILVILSRSVVKLQGVLP